MSIVQRAWLSSLLIIVESVFVLYLTDDLNPVLDLNMTVVNPQMTEIWNVADLPNGGALPTMSEITEPSRC